ncbi:hypothetical protein [Planctomyces sp. SH-PL14]|uniref:hypothetical protein n=1 Tax=Planctomyces sp. SH-PL14 TaxID=1632864 RepID=UPI00078BAA3A|nr:hypothetical protein [Planctomyces sp. SH-PL14]AMV19730.1 hypothetical protein VT03_17670 [Planctomyces sp. SH-PL14]
MGRKLEIENEIEPVPATELATTVAGEDLKIGDDVAILNETFETPGWIWDCDINTHSPQEPVRTRYASRDPGVPFRVQAICLPFVFLKSPRKEHRTIDLRMVQLVRVSAAYAKCVRKALRPRTL